MTSKSVALQRGSHRNQLKQYAWNEATPDSVHAIVVPSSRHAKQLSPAVQLARANECALLVLCSRQSVAAEVRALWSGEVDLIAVDVPTDSVMPTFGTDRLIKDTPFERDTDLSLKRNLGLVLSLLADWRRIIFLDDDISVPVPFDLQRAAGLLGRYPAVGLGLAGFPDNSVVCHANRAVGRFQETFIGGGAMAVDVRRMNSFFPNIYNEDWFFLVAERKTRRYGVIGEAWQDDYDPYGTPDRARSEEFGDCLAEGLYSLLDIGAYEQSMSTDYWAEFLQARRALIAEISRSVDSLAEEASLRERISAALSAAEERCALIEPEFCVEYLSAWRQDRSIWSQFVLRMWRDHQAADGESATDAASRALGLIAPNTVG